MAYPGEHPGGEMPLHVVSQDTKTLTLGWTHPSSAGYKFESSAGGKAHTWDHTRRTVRFAKGSAWYRVEALDISATGEIRS